MPSPPPHILAGRFAGIIATLLAMVGARLERPGKPGLAGPLAFAIHIRLEGIRNRITRYVARFQAGTLAPPRPRTRAVTPRRRSTSPGKWDHLPKLPRGRLWLVRLVPGIGVGANYLRILLDEPDMVAMLQAAPQIGRTLRPFWHMLSKEKLPPILQHPRPAPAPPAQPAPAAEDATRSATEAGPPPRPPTPRLRTPLPTRRAGRRANVPPVGKTA